MTAYAPATARERWEDILAEYGPAHPRIQETRATAHATTRNGRLYTNLLAAFHSWTPPGQAQDTDALARLLGLDPATAATLAQMANEAPQYGDPCEQGVTWHGVLITGRADHFELTPALAGPTCEAHEHVGYCPHGSCNSLAGEAPWLEECWKGCGWQHVTDAGGGQGFAGGAVYWTNLDCGHTNMDESGDVAAAR